MTDNVYIAYYNAPEGYKKERALAQVIANYERYANKLSYKYSQVFPMREPDDWKNLVRFGIWEGLERAKDKPIEEVPKSIYYRIKHQISKEIQLITARKQTYFHEIVYDLLTYGKSSEDEWIRRIDIEEAINLLPEKTKKIVKMWMDGYPVLSCAWNEVPVDPCICLEVGLKDAAVYLRLKDGFEKIKEHLESYSEVI